MSNIKIPDGKILLREVDAWRNELVQKEYNIMVESVRNELRANPFKNVVSVQFHDVLKYGDFFAMDLCKKFSAESFNVTYSRSITRSYACVYDFFISYRPFLLGKEYDYLAKAFGFDIEDETYNKEHQTPNEAPNSFNIAAGDETDEETVNGKNHKRKRDDLVNNRNKRNINI